MNAKTKIYLQRIALLIGSVFTVVLVAETAAYILIQNGYRLTPPLPPPPSSASKRPLLPYQIAESLTQHKQYLGNLLVPMPAPGDKIVFDAPVVDPNGTEFKFKENFSGRLKSTNQTLGTTIFDVQVTTDNYGRRISKPIGSKRKSQQHLFFLGCSYIFGVAVNDWETVPWRINEMQTEFEAYNNATFSFGTSDVLRISYKPDFAEGLEQKKGIAIYNFIPDHLFRMINSTINRPWGASLASMRETSDGHFEYEGSFRESHRIKTHVFKMLANTNLFELLKIQLPPVTDHTYDLAARMILEIRNNYRKRTNPDNLFIVALYPDPTDNIDLNLLRASLSRHKIDFLDYSHTRMEVYFNHYARVPYDGHPNAASHKLYAQVLMKDIETFLKKRDTAQ